MSTYEGEHTIFGLLGQANLTQNDVIVFLKFFSQKLSKGYDHSFSGLTGIQTIGFSNTV
jgi:hypothetical protein